MGTRKTLLSGIVVALLAALAATAYWRSTPAEEVERVVGPPPQSVDHTVPEAKLLDSVLYIDDWREYGKPVGFFYVPKSRPPGLTDIMPGNPPDLSGGSHVGTGNGARLDGYNVTAAGSRLSVIVEFAAGATSTCAWTKESAHAVCARNGRLRNIVPADPDYRHVTVYLTADSDAALETPQAMQIRRFWATTDLVPVGEAQWFTDLATRARASVVGE
jgi:hypothetical protein